MSSSEHSKKGTFSMIQRSSWKFVLKSAGLRTMNSVAWGRQSSSANVS